MIQFLAVPVRSILEDLQASNHGRVELELHLEVDIVSDARKPHSAAQVVRFRPPIAKPLHGRYFCLRERIEHAYLHYVTCAQIWDLKFSLFLDPFPLFRVDVVEKSLAFVEGRWRNFGRPVELRVVPLIKLLLLFRFRVVALVWQVLIVVSNLIKYGSLLPLPVNLFVPRTFQIFFKPQVERCVRGSIWPFRLPLTHNFHFLNCLRLPR